MITSAPTFGADLADVDTVEPDPIRLMLMWLPSNDVELRPLMSLATVDEHGDPDCRSVLVSRADGRGLHFHTDSASRKATQLEARPRATAVLAWPDVGRQLVVSGSVERETIEESDAAFAGRSSYLQVLAWANTAETAQLALADRRAEWARFAQRDALSRDSSGTLSGTLTAPPTWVGYVLRPLRLTFWRGDVDGPSNRVEYRSTPAGWDVVRLPG